MKTIYKYEIPANRDPIRMPINSKILTVKYQGEKICVWAEVDKNEEMYERSFDVFGTGHDMNDSPVWNREYLGTVFMADLVFHVYETF